MANTMRYNYLRGPGGLFRNPFDQGVRKNCSDFWIKGYNEDVECADESSAHDEEIGLMPISRAANMENGLVQSHQTKGNGHLAINVNSNNLKTEHEHGHEHGYAHSHCNPGRTNGVPLGLGLGLGRNSTRSPATS